MDEFEGAECFLRKGNFAPVLCSSLQGLQSDCAGGEVDVKRAKCEGLGDAGAGVSQGKGESLYFGPSDGGSGLEEALTFGRCKVFAAPAIDELNAPLHRFVTFPLGRCNLMPCRVFRSRGFRVPIELSA